MTRASERPRNTIKPEEEMSNQTTENVEKKKNPPVWTEEEEKALIESLKIHKWGDWKAVEADIGTRSASAIDGKMRRLCRMSPDKNESAIKAELIALSKMVSLTIGIL